MDARINDSPGLKYSHWELKGVPIRIDVRRSEGRTRSSKKEGFGIMAVAVDDGGGPSWPWSWPWRMARASRVCGVL